MDPARLVFLDETSVATNMARRYGRCPASLRLVAAAPHGHCHTTTFAAGLRLGGSLIPQAHVDDYPVYRLEWQALGSLQRRLRGCLSGVRAQVAGWDSAELMALQVYLSRRSAGMAMQPPGVRP